MIKLAVIGDPIEHSLSPVVHGAVLDQLGVAYEYERIQVKKGELQEFLDYAKANGINGFNLTMPHKVDILPFLDEICGDGIPFRAVNTVRIKDGKLYGYNTDAQGYCRALSAAGSGMTDQRVVILGAGGVARTLLHKGALEGAASLTVLNRTLAQAELVCREIALETGQRATPLVMNEKQLRMACMDCDLLIQATPLGMRGMKTDFEDLRFLEALPGDAMVTDLIYHPYQTSFLKKAASLGNPTLNGLGMLIYQAMLADEIYLERRIDMEKIYPAVAERVQKK